MERGIRAAIFKICRGRRILVQRHWGLEAVSRPEGIHADFIRRIIQRRNGFQRRIGLHVGWFTTKGVFYMIERFSFNIGPNWWSFSRNERQTSIRLNNGAIRSLFRSAVGFKRKLYEGY